MFIIYKWSIILRRNSQPYTGDCWTMYLFCHFCVVILFVMSVLFVILFVMFFFVFSVLVCHFVCHVFVICFVKFLSFEFWYVILFVISLKFFVYVCMFSWNPMERSCARYWRIAYLVFLDFSSLAALSWGVKLERREKSSIRCV